MWPVIVRELRVASRGQFTYWLRLIGAGTTCGAAVLAGLLSLGAGNRGNEIFSALHLTLFCAIWLFVPLAAADCLSRERREGTLGLLFLTPLKPIHITMAKTLTQSLRAFTLWLATLPIMVLPMLMGGVVRSEALLSILINASSFCWALAAGIWVSSRSREFHRAVLGALSLAFGMFGIYLVLNYVLAALMFAPPGGLKRTPWLMSPPIGFMVLGNVENTWKELLTEPKFSRWLFMLGGFLVFSFLILLLIILRTASILRATWQTSAAPARWTVWRQRLCTPVIFRDVYRRWLRWSLDSNPVGWLERRTWSARSVKWGWLAVVCTFYSVVLTGGALTRNIFTEMQVLVAAGLVASAGLSAAASFRRERDNGVLSLLLVSPLPVRHIVGGRLRALWGQHLLAVGLLLGAWLYLYTTFGHSRDPFWVGFFGVCFVSIPVIGLYCSLWRETFFGSLAWTGLLSAVLPVSASLIVMPVVAPIFEIDLSGTRPVVLIVAATGQLGLAVMCFVLLVRKLKRRSFKLPAV